MYYRKKKGKGFSYTDENGKTVTDTAVKTYLKSLVIPPAWKEVEISEKKNSKICQTSLISWNDNHFNFSSRITPSMKIRHTFFR